MLGSQITITHKKEKNLLQAWKRSPALFSWQWVGLDPTSPASAVNLWEEQWELKMVSRTYGCVRLMVDTTPVEGCMRISAEDHQVLNKKKKSSSHLKTAPWGRWVLVAQGLAQRDSVRVSSGVGVLGTYFTMSGKWHHQVLISKGGLEDIKDLISGVDLL